MKKGGGENPIVKEFNDVFHSDYNTLKKEAKNGYR